MNVDASRLNAKPGPSLAFTMRAVVMITLPLIGCVYIFMLDRHGAWTFTTTSQRFALLSFVLVWGLAAALASSLLIWAALRLAELGYQRLKRSSLAVLLGLSMLGWLVALLVSDNLIEFYLNPAYGFLLGAGLILVATVARGHRTWQFWDIAVVVVALAGLGVLGLWLNFLVMRDRSAVLSHYANIGLWLGVYAWVWGGVTVGNQIAGWRQTQLRRGGWRICAPLIILVIVGLIPTYRWAYRASEPSLSSTSAGKTSLPTEERDGAIEKNSGRPNIILISLDTLRADHLGTYGYEFRTSPNIDRFFANGVVFENAYAQAPWTLPSHASMLTGMHVSTHGARLHPNLVPGYVDRLEDDLVTIAEMLGSHGYDTAGFTGGGYVSADYGFDQGFGAFKSAKSRRIREVLDNALAWLETPRTKPFFLFLHTFDIHRYNPPELSKDLSDGGYDGRLKQLWLNDPEALEALAGSDRFYQLDDASLSFLKFLYDSEIRWVDSELDRLFEVLHRQRPELLAQTYVILTSDHGEAFWEHEITGHGKVLYDPVVRVPLLVSGPAVIGPHRASSAVQSIDLVPTILELTGVSNVFNLPGASLVPALTGGTVPEHPILIEGDAMDSQVALVSRGHKYITYDILSHNLLEPRLLLLSMHGLLSPYAQEHELFDLTNDPAEKRTLISENLHMMQSHRRRLAAILAYARAKVTTTTTQSTPMSDETEEELRSLGYIQ